MPNVVLIVSDDHGDLAARHPDVVAGLTSRHDAWRRRLDLNRA